MPVKLIHCVKSIRIRIYSRPHFPRIFPAFFRIRTEDGEIQSISLYSVQMREKYGPE